MAKYPYTPAPGNIAAAVNQLKKAFPPKVTSETLKKLAIAPNNESYVINTLRFLGTIDEDGTKTSQAGNVFSKHDTGEFQQAFGDMVKAAYADLFALYNEAAWSQDTNKLISFFRQSDNTSDVVGRRQAATFQMLASYAGHGEPPATKALSASHKATPTGAKSAGETSVKTKVPAPKPRGSVAAQNSTGSTEIALTVRVEVNLPPAADQDTYDKIFRSIRENLLNGK